MIDMPFLKRLRILLVLDLFIPLIIILLVMYYDPTVSPLVQQVAAAQAEFMNYGLALFELGILVAEFIALIYAFVALWVGHRSGKWAFLLYVTLGCFDTYLLNLVVLSGLTMVISNIGLLLAGITLAMVFSAQFKVLEK